MYQFKMNSKDLAEAMKKASIALPVSKGKGENECIRLVINKKSKRCRGLQSSNSSVQWKSSDDRGA